MVPTLLFMCFDEGCQAQCICIVLFTTDSVTKQFYRNSEPPREQTRDKSGEEKLPQSRRKRPWEGARLIFLGLTLDIKTLTQLVLWGYLKSDSGTKLQFVLNHCSVSICAFIMKVCQNPHAVHWVTQPWRPWRLGMHDWYLLLIQNNTWLMCFYLLWPSRAHTHTQKVSKVSQETTISGWVGHPPLHHHIPHHTINGHL